jgi:GTP-binding protein Era
MSTERSRSGFVALLGRPNVGKSTLLNRMVGQKIAIESPVAQTTRHRIKGVVTLPKGQLVFLDTPGFSKPLDQLGEYLTQESFAALSEADAFVMVVDGTQAPGKGDAWVAEQIRKTGKFVVLVLNKSDLMKGDPSQKKAQGEAYAALFEGYETVKVLSASAKTGKNVPEILEALVRKMPRGPLYYPEDALTDQRMREISAEIIREKVLLSTQEEIPHSVAVGIERFEEDPTRGMTSIYATLYVDQKSQKGMLIGKGGQMIKKIGSEARKDLEAMMEGPVFLELTVKVKENWRKDPQFLMSLGLAPPTA